MKLIHALLFLLPSIAFAGPATVVKVEALASGGGWTFHVTLAHEDTGWDHYADGWGVYTLGGEELGYRVLAHPHVNEQPFTRSLSGVEIPAGVTEVVIKPRDLVHGVGQDFKVTLPGS